jgi:uncharacterized membrane protein
MCSMKRTPRPERIIAFSDGVVAIAITLVVLPLVDTARDADLRSVGQFLSDNAPALGAAALSFVVIANFWEAHHTVFERIEGITRGMLRTNFAWLAAIVFLPLPTVLLVGTHSGDRLGTVLYIGTMVVATSSLAVTTELGRRAGVVRAPEGDEPSEATLRRRRWLPAVLMIVALVLAAAVPGVGAWALLVLLVSIPAERVWRVRGDRAGRRP